MAIKLVERITIGTLKMIGEHSSLSPEELEKAELAVFIDGLGVVPVAGATMAAFTDEKGGHMIQLIADPLFIEQKVAEETAKKERGMRPLDS